MAHGKRMSLVTNGAKEGDMAMEGQFSNPALGVEVEARRRAQIISALSTIGIISGIGLVIGLLVLAAPFSGQTAISLSLLS
jgi:hypothetical protein